MIFRRMVLGDGPTISRRMSPCIVLEGSPTHSPRRVVLYFLLKFGSVFSRTTGFVLKTVFFSYMAWVSVRESVRTRDMGMGMYTFK